MDPKTRAGAPKSARDLLSGEIVTTISANGPNGQPNSAPTLSEFQLQAGCLAARYGLSGGHAETILRHLRGLP